MLWGKSFGNFFDTQKKIFSGHFFGKKLKKNLENFFKGEKIFKIKKTFFSKKCPKKIFFLSVKKIVKTFSP